MGMGIQLSAVQTAFAGDPSAHVGRGPLRRRRLRAPLTAPTGPGAPDPAEGKGSSQTIIRLTSISRDGRFLRSSACCDSEPFASLGVQTTFFLKKSVRQLNNAQRTLDRRQVAGAVEVEVVV